MPNHDVTPILNQENQSKLNTINIIRESISPVLSAIGIGNYYGQTLTQPILGALGAFIHIPNIGVNVWNLTTPPNFKNKLINSIKKISLGLGLITIVNYQQWVNQLSNLTPIIPSDYTTTTTPFITTTTLHTTTTTLHTTTTNNPFTTTTTNDPFSTTTYTTTTTNDPFTSFLLTSDVETKNKTDLTVYSMMSVYGVTQIISGIAEFLPNKLAKGINTLSSLALTATGISIGVLHGYNNTTAPVTTIAGIIATVNAIVPSNQPSDDIPLQQNIFPHERERFTNSHARLINACDTTSYGSIGSMDTMSLDSDVVIWDRSNPYQPTTRLL